MTEACLFAWIKMYNIEMNLALIKKNISLHNQPTYPLISWVGDPGDHRGLWERVCNQGVMS